MGLATQRLGDYAVIASWFRRKRIAIPVQSHCDYSVNANAVKTCRKTFAVSANIRNLVA